MRHTRIVSFDAEDHISSMRHCDGILSRWLAILCRIHHHLVLVDNIVDVTSRYFSHPGSARSLVIGRCTREGGTGAPASVETLQRALITLELHFLNQDSEAMKSLPSSYTTTSTIAPIAM